MSDKIVRMLPSTAQGTPRGDPRAQPKNDRRSKPARGARSRAKGRESDEVEVDGRRNTKRGRSVNDLLNFQFHHPTPRAYQHSGSRKVSAYSKEQFVQVSCQFVVRSGEWQSLCVPDSVVDWEHVVQVILPCNELPSCPICLYPPSCPLTPICGHAMCYSCTLQYVDKCPEGGCPICHVNLSIDAMRPLLTRYKAAPRVGQEMTFTMVHRLRNSTVVAPAHVTANMMTPPNIGSPWGSRYCNIVTATVEQVLSSVHLVQQQELSTQLLLVDELCQDSQPYILQAIAEVECKHQACYAEIEQGAEQGAEQEVIEEGASSQKKVYFYQSSDGQPVYIHPVNAKCLIAEYGAIERSPGEIVSTVVDIEYLTMTAELRSKHRYISHLPLGSVFAMCEVDIAGFVSADTLAKCGRDIELRARGRSKKEKREREYNDQFSEQEVTYHCSAYLPQYTEVSQPAADHYKSTTAYTDLTAEPLSFAEKLRKGASSESPWVNNVSSSGRARLDSEVSEEGQAPSYQTSFSASLNDAFANFDIQHQDGSRNSSGGVGEVSLSGTATNPAGLGGRGKKKKKGKTILLTTGGARRQ